MAASVTACSELIKAAIEAFSEDSGGDLADGTEELMKRIMARIRSGDKQTLFTAVLMAIHNAKQRAGRGSEADRCAERETLACLEMLVDALRGRGVSEADLIIGLDKQNASSKTALMLAAVFDYEHAALFLLERGAGALALEAGGSWSPLHLAAHNCAKKALRVLLLYAGGYGGVWAAQMRDRTNIAKRTNSKD